MAVVFWYDKGNKKTVNTDNYSQKDLDKIK